ncbi:CHRD domain-containing protein [Dyadobacter tibetensis]|uniref:CHRD domain-containing protein n=1 Tax=Dyadobacter tibetensis TaxID=1211851 RepID=UPI00047278F0|nr:CHRD domain-containing protein [Dyadobacter tibetensis]
MKSNITKFWTLLALVGLLVGCSQDHNPPKAYVQMGLKLSGHQENPAVGTAAVGSVDVSYNEITKILSYTIRWDGLTGAPTGAHIHGPALRGSNASVLHNFGASLPATPSGIYMGQVTIDGATLKEDDLLNGLYYFNIHTATHPGGEIRGQIEFYDPMKLVQNRDLPISPAQEVPAVSSSAEGMMDVVYNKTTKKLSFTLAFRGLSGNPTMAHIHGPAAAGTNGGVKVDLSSFLPSAGMGVFSHSLDVDGTTLNEADLLAGKYYVNIHTAAHPSGEIRGQIVF